MTFTIDILPRNDTDARLTFVVEADDWLEALRIGLEEAGLDQAWTGSAHADLLPGGRMRVVDRATGRIFDVQADPPEAGVVPEPLPLFSADSGQEQSPLVREERAPASGGGGSDLDESSLERYFDDEPTDEEVRAAIRGELGERAGDAARAQDATVGTAAAAHEGTEDERVSELAQVLANLPTYEEDVDAALDFVCFSLLKPLDADVACALLLDKKGKSLVFAGVAGDAPPKLRRYRYPRGLGLPWLALERAAPLVVNGAEHDPRFAREIVAKTGFLVHATVLCPVGGVGGPRGVLQVVRNREGVAGFAEGDARLLEQAARSLGRHLDVLDERA